MSKQNTLANFGKWEIREKHKNLQLQVFSNALILKNILKYSNLSGLNAARKVSKFWNEMANSYLRNYALITFDIHQNGSNSSFCSNELPLKIQAFKKLKLRHLKITSNRETSSPGCYSSNQKPVVKLFTELFQACKTQITIVELNLRNETDSSKQIIQSLFEECRCISSIFLFMNLSTIFQNGSEVTTSAKSLTLCCKQGNYEKLFELFPDLQQLRVGFSASFEFRNIQFTPVYKELLKNLKSFHFNGFYPELTELEHFAQFPSELEELEFYIHWIPSPNNYCMSRFSNSLLKFSANIESWRKAKRRSVFFPKMLTLETLLLRCRNPKNVDSWVFNWELEADTFPKLKRFEVDCSVDAEHLLNSFLVEENRKQFPNLEEAFINVVEYDEDLSIRRRKLKKNFVTWKN